MLAKRGGMSWQKRLIELVCAGGTIAGVAPLSGCNAFPDACGCTTGSNSPACQAEQACRQLGGELVCTYGSTDGGAIGRCVGLDAAVHPDARIDAPRLPDGHPAD